MGKGKQSFFLTFFESLKNSLPFLFFALLGIGELIYFSINGLGNDFQVFYDASKLALNLENPWRAVIDPIHSAYVNGPMTALIISPLALMPQSVALAVTRSLSIILVPVINYHLVKFFYPKSLLNIKSTSLWVSSSFVLLAFPTRANLEYGQFFFVFATLAVLSLRLSKSHSIKSLVLSGILIGICCDYKPQAFIVIAALLCFSHRFIFLGSVFSFVVGAVTSTILTWDIPYKVWIEVIFKKLKGGSTGDQMHIYGVLPVFLSYSIAFFVLICFLILLYRQIRNFLTPEFRFLTIFVSILLIPWMHPTDLGFLSAYIFTVKLKTRQETFFGLLGLGSLIVWSSNPLIGVLVAFLALFIIQVQLKNCEFVNQVSLLIVTFPSIIFAITANYFPGLIETNRQYWGLSSLMCLLVLSFISVFELPKKDLSTKI
jgi:hypothetical protein